jgi:hypothetical protein
MKKTYPLISLAIVSLVFLSFPLKAYAIDNEQFKKEFTGLYVKASQVNRWLNYNSKVDIYPHATGYYDDLVDHYENDLLTLDTLSSGL